MNDSKYSGHRDLEWVTGLNRLSLRVLGLWPKPDQTSRGKLKCNLHILAISLVIIFSLMFPCIHSMIRVHKDIMLISDHLQFILPLITCIVRIVIFRWNKEAMISMMNMITEDWLEVRNVQERDMMIIWARRTRITVICSYCIMTISYFCITILPFLGISTSSMANITDKLLPLPTYYIYDVTKTPQYELTYISHAIGCFLAITSYTGIDNFLGLLVFHICGQLDILSTRLMYLDKLLKFHIGLKNCVMHHIRLLRAIALIEDTYNIILLVLFLYFVIYFAFCGFWVIDLLEKKDHLSISRMMCIVVIIMNACMHMALYCAVGEILITQCDMVYSALYNQEWYSLAPKQAKGLIPLMIRSRQAPSITAGKMFPMMMVTFSNLIKTSAGYISILLTTRN